MKIRFWDRVLLFLCALALLLSGAYLIAQAVMFLSMAEPPMPTVHIWMWAQAGAGLLLAVLGACLFVLPGRLFSHKRDFVIQQTENGELRIAVKAIENLVQKCIDVHPEIRVVSMRVRNSREGVVIDLRISLANNISIPLAVASLQKQIRQYLSASSGIDVKEIRVSVETAEDAAAESPYLVSGEQASHPSAEKAAEAKPKEKPALHRRIFGHSEQPAIVPEAPAAPEPPKEPEVKEPEPAKEAEAPAAPREEPAQEQPKAEPAPDAAASAQESNVEGEAVKNEQ